MALQDLESAIFDGHLSHLHVDWPTLGSNPQKKLLGRFLVLVGAASKVQVPVTSHGARRLHDMAVRGRSPRVPRWIAALKSSARLERRQWRADEVFGQWNHSEDAKAEKCLEEWLQVLYADTDAKEMRRQALCDALPGAIQDIKAKLVEGKPKEVLLKSLHWLILQSDYLVLKDRFGLCLPVLLQILDSSTDSSLRFLGWDVLNLLLDRAIATEVQNFSVCLADFFQTHSPYPQEDICGLSVVPFSQSFAQFLTKAFADGKSDACVSREKQLEFFFTFGFFHCKSAKSEPFTLFMEFGLLPLLETSMLAPNLQELSQQLLQSCEGPQILEVLLSWRAIVLLFNQLPQRLGRYFQDILLRVIFSYLTFLISDPPEGLADVDVTDYDLAGFRSPVAACMTQAEWEEAISRRAELEALLGEVLKMLAQHQAGLFNKTLMQLQSGSSFPAKNLAVEFLSPQLQLFVRFAREVAETVEEAGAQKCLPRIAATNRYNCKFSYILYYVSVTNHYIPFSGYCGEGGDMATILT